MILCGRFRSGLLARVSTIAIIAAASSLGTSPMARAQCSEALIVTTTPITGTHPCAIATFVTGTGLVVDGGFTAA